MYFDTIHQMLSTPSSSSSSSLSPIHFIRSDLSSFFVQHNTTIRYNSKSRSIQDSIRICRVGKSIV